MSYPRRAELCYPGVMTRRIAAIVMAVSLIAFRGGEAAAQTLPQMFLSAAPVASPVAAVGEAVQTGGASYAGDCSTTTPADIGADCSKFVASEGTLQAYMIGPTFSEFTDWVFVEQNQSGWIPVGSAAFHDTAGAQQVPWPEG
jgi:hypothetical protein